MYGGLKKLGRFLSSFFSTTIWTSRGNLFHRFSLSKWYITPLPFASIWIGGWRKNESMNDFCSSCTTIWTCWANVFHNFSLPKSHMHYPSSFLFHLNCRIKVKNESMKDFCSSCTTIWTSWASDVHKHSLVRLCNILHLFLSLLLEQQDDNEEWKHDWHLLQLHNNLNINLSLKCYSAYSHLLNYYSQQSKRPPSVFLMEMNNLHSVRKSRQWRMKVWANSARVAQQSVLLKQKSSICFHCITRLSFASENLQRQKTIKYFCLENVFQRTVFIHTWRWNDWFRYWDTN